MYSLHYNWNEESTKAQHSLSATRAEDGRGSKEWCCNWCDSMLRERTGKLQFNCSCVYVRLQMRNSFYYLTLTAEPTTRLEQKNRSTAAISANCKLSEVLFYVSLSMHQCTNAILQAHMQFQLYFCGCELSRECSSNLRWVQFSKRDNSCNFV